MDPVTAAVLTTAVTAAVNLLVENLSHLVGYNSQLIAGSEEAFNDLLVEVKRLNAFLVDNGELRSNSSQWDVLVDEIRRTVYDAENVIDKFLVQTKLNQENVLKKLFKVNFQEKNFAGKINKILEDVKKIREDHKQLFEPCSRMNSSDHQPEKIVQETQGPSLENNEVVGFDEEAKKVIERLVEGSESLDVIPIEGMPGLGKTTLARKIFNDPKIPDEFFYCVWVFVGQSYIKKDILFNILKGFTKRIEEFQDMDETEIAEEVCDRVDKSGGKCLIVLDDVWDSDIVDFVKTVFPENNRGHRIMATTRYIHVARAVNADPHNLKFLTQKESFQLLEKRAFGKSRCPVELKEYGEGIVEKCSGVPLTIVVIAGALRGRTNDSDWKVVKENVGKYLIEKDEHQRCLKIVGLSYNHLPQDRKACFLYFGAFPQGFDIPAWKLIRLWIAEGLIMSNLPGSEIEEIAECHLNDFANRNLVMVMEKRCNGQIKTCRVHDMLHEFCIKEATRLCLIQQVYITPGQDTPSIQNSNTSSRRLSVQSSVPKNFISKNPATEHVRSFLCFSSKRKQIDLSNIDVQRIPKAFPLIRILEIESLKFCISRDFYQLFHLRYIAMSGDLNELPKLFSYFWNLQTLVLNTSKAALDIKADIWNMSRLRHLHTNKPAKLPPPTTSTSSCLQTLSLVAPESCNEDVLAKAVNLKRLSIEGKLEAFLEASKGEFSNFPVLRHLENLTLLNDDLSKALHLSLAFLKCLPKLKKLTLSKTRFDWNEANWLGQLECLEVLKLKEDAFTGKTWKVETGGFRKLRVLHIENAKFETWEASNCPFPRLRNLVLVSCVDLKAVPLELADLEYLQEMTLENTKKANESAKEIECKKQEKQTPESVKFKLTIPY